MFELDQAVDAWCRSIHTSAYNRNERLEELKDHLYCVVERFRTEGLSEQQAFSKATEHMGDVGMLAIEQAKNKSLRFKFCQTEENLEKWRDSTSPKSAAAMNIFISVACAIGILFSTWILEHSSYAEYAQTVMYLLIAVWFVPFSYLSAIANKEREHKKATSC